MSDRQTKLIVAGALLVGGALVACTAGVGSPVEIGQAYGDKPGVAGTTDRPGVDGQDPASGAPRSGTGGNTSGKGKDDTSSNGGTSGSGAGCPPCDGTFTCEVTVGGQKSKTTLPLATKSGNCVASVEGTDIIVACGGDLTQGGQSIGSWKDCTPAASTGSSGSSGASGSPTPTPPPPTDVDAGGG